MSLKNILEESLLHLAATNELWGRIFGIPWKRFMFSDSLMRTINLVIICELRFVIGRENTCLFWSCWVWWIEAYTIFYVYLILYLIYIHTKRSYVSIIWSSSLMRKLCINLNIYIHHIGVCTIKIHLQLGKKNPCVKSSIPSAMYQPLQNIEPLASNLYYNTKHWYFRDC